MNSKDSIISIVKEQEPALRGLGIKSLGLFGSHVRGEATNESDIDFLYEFEEGRSTLRNWMQAQEVLEQALGRKIDFVSRKFVSPYLKPSIMQELEPILE